MSRSVLIAFALIGFASSAFAQCVPGTNQVAVFKDDTYRGTCRVLDVGSYPTPASMSFPNDEMSSIKLGTGATAVICEHNNYGGTCELFTVSDSNFGGNRIDHDRASSMKVFAGPPPSCDPGPQQVSLYETANFAPGICLNVGFGEYPNSTAMGFANDSLSSIKVGASAEVVLCKHDNYQGDCQRVTTNLTNIDQTRIGNNAVSSIVVMARGAMPCIPAANQVALYVHRDFEMPCMIRDQNEYPNSGAIGLPNDSISAVRVGAQAQACACTDESYRGACERFLGDDPDLRDNATAMNDSISSLKVQAPGAQCNAAPPPGYQRVEVTNCNFYKRIVTVWTRDVTPQSEGPWVRVGAQNLQYDALLTNCPVPGTAPLIVQLPVGRYTIVAAVDPLRENCGGINFPNFACIAGQTVPLYGEASGKIGQLFIRY